MFQNNSKPPRMRTACTECHASKVRCNSDKNGCARCMQNHLKCVYKVSMVGRTSRKRQAPDSCGGLNLDLHRRKVSISAIDQGAADQSRDGDSDLLCSPAASAMSDPLGTPLPEIGIDPASTQFLAIPRYSTSLSLDDYSTTAADQPQLDFSTGPAENWWEAPGPGDGGAPSLLFPDDSYRVTQQTAGGRVGGAQHAGSLRARANSTNTRPATTSTATPPSISAHHQHHHHHDTDTHSNSNNTATTNNSSVADDDGRRRLGQIMSLCRKASTLEGQLQSRLSTLDEIMKMNKTCLAEIAEITGARRDGGGSRKAGREGSSSPSHICRCSLAVIATCLDTMLTLFEDVVERSGLDPRSSSSSGGGGGHSASSAQSPPAEARMPSLHFGVFEIDPLEQAIVARRILARELQSYRDVVRMLATTFHAHPNDTFRKLMGQWCLSLVTRVERLPIALDVG
ncbi:hypothetical protein MCOR02_009465 [Pyricularia oryzae]|nr:hypothetical protein MCOR02_009465 [Pyricularia oryzae]KAI6324582.1 hypothetical protein MCOR34_001437 [Pyricularia oryzae]KAI6327199.1 hypothetical protein MCOR29_003153 [Pyricularia oryzae]KAI6331362.1 hypothetical protein MCOR30_004861 [Pyricularia oryzae]KAI6348109.1 hypothetical protein MCOR28_001890 [Pyricularia oryzae]